MDDCGELARKCWHRVGYHGCTVRFGRDDCMRDLGAEEGRGKGVLSEVCEIEFGEVPFIVN